MTLHCRHCGSTAEECAFEIDSQGPIPHLFSESFQIFSIDKRRCPCAVHQNVKPATFEGKSLFGVQYQEVDVYQIFWHIQEVNMWENYAQDVEKFLTEIAIWDELEFATASEAAHAWKRQERDN